MNTCINKSKDPVAIDVTSAQLQTNKTAIHLQDNRPQTIVQKKQIEAMTSPQVIQRRELNTHGHLQLNDTCTIQLHGPGFQNSVFGLGDGAHLDRHLDEWQEYFPEVKTEQDVERIARELFDETAQEDWKNKGGTYAVDHKYRGQTVRLVWGLGGIVSCFIVTPRHQPQPHQQQVQAHQPHNPYQQAQPYHPQQQQPQQQQPQVHNPHQQGYPQAPQQAQYHIHRNYYWSPDWNYWWDPALNQWRPRFEGQIDWYYQ